MLQSICISFCGGLLFGLSLLHAQKVLFLSKNPLFAGIISTIRLLVISIFFYIMLKSTQIHPIILVVSFLLAYWLIILKFKEFLHGKQ
jgi:hypothetical protein